MAQFKEISDRKEEKTGLNRNSLPTINLTPSFEHKPVTHK